MPRYPQNCSDMGNDKSFIDVDYDLVRIYNEKNDWNITLIINIYRELYVHRNMKEKVWILITVCGFGLSKNTKKLITHIMTFWFLKKPTDIYP